MARDVRVYPRLTVLTRVKTGVTCAVVTHTLSARGARTEHGLGLLPTAPSDHAGTRTSIWVNQSCPTVGGIGAPAAR